MLTRPRFLLALICIAHFSVDFMWGIWPLFKTIRGIDLAYAGIIGGVGAFIAEFSQIYFASWSDRGARFLVIAIGVIMAMAMPWISLGSDLLVYALVYLTFAIGSAAFHPSAAGGLATLFPQSRSLVLGIFWASGGLGLALSQLTFASVYTAMEGWTVPLSLLGVPIIFLALLIHRSKYVIGVAKKEPFAFSEIFQFFQRRDTRLLWIFHFSIASIYWGTLYYFPDILREKSCPDWVCDGTGHLFFVLGAAFMALPAGWIADKFSPRAVLLATVFVSMLAYFTLLAVPDLPLVVLLGLSMIIGAGLGIVTPLTISWGNALVPESPGLVSAFLMGLVWFASELVGITGVGLLSGFFETGAATQSLVVLGSLFVLASFSLYFLGRREEMITA